MTAEVGWHATGVDDVAAALDVDLAGGLATAEAARRLEVHGPNDLPVGRQRGIGTLLLEQVADPMIAILVAAAVIAVAIGEPLDAAVIAVIVLLNAVIGVLQGYRAERAMEALRTLATPAATVVRDGVARTVPAEQVVPGDVVVLLDGAAVPADVRLVEASGLRVAEAALTGESEPVGKRVDPANPADAVLADRTTMAFRGTFVARGHGRGIAVATGAATELGRVAGLLETATQVRTPLQRRLARLGGWLVVAVLVICALVFVAGLLRGEDPAVMFLTAVSLAVAAVPEALPAVVAVSLALGARRMAHRKSLVRRLPAVETLGSVTVICSDKTGTITENKMAVEVLEGTGGPDEPAPAELLRAVLLCNDAEAQRGDPTETALVVAAMAAGLDPAAQRAASPRVAEVPFDSDRKRMTTVHQTGDGLVAYLKGAPESVLRCCGPTTDAAAALLRAEALAARGLRVLAVAAGPVGEVPADPADLEHGLTLLGLVGLIDPPRAEAAAAVAECVTAGIVPVMITGDHPGTAEAIARRVGIVEHPWQVLTGGELAQMDDAELDARADEIRVYARTDPEQKIRIVRALQDRGQVVAMTGDGVNDAPALRQADIGVAMGAGGTDVAREAADMVLLDDRFATIVHAVEEGRRIYDDIRKFVRYVLTGNSGEIWTIFLAPFLGLPVPLLPIHILWVNLVTDGLPGLALAEEPAEQDVMRRPPRPPRESIVAHGLARHALLVGLLIGALTLGTQAWAIETGRDHWQSMVFTVLVFCQLVHAMVIRSETQSLFSLGLASNRSLLSAVVLSVAVQMALLYVPALQPVFRTAPLTPLELLVVFVVPLGVLVWVETEKWLIRRGVVAA